MDILNEMWKTMAGYQPNANANGHGESWARMCQERTQAAIEIAAYEAGCEGDEYLANEAYAAYDIIDALK